MRTDTLSLNPGKAMAQAAHAANMLSEAAHAARIAKCEHSEWLWEAYQEWIADRGFGTTITLAAPFGDQDFDNLERQFDQPAFLPISVADRVVDPTYPVSDGEVTHLVEFTPCFWVFGDATDLAPVLEKYQLHR